MSFCISGIVVSLVLVIASPAGSNLLERPSHPSPASRLAFLTSSACQWPLNSEPRTRKADSMSHRPALSTRRGQGFLFATSCVASGGDKAQQPPPLYAANPPSPKPSSQPPPEQELDFPKSTRQDFQDACFPKLVRVGQSVPDHWVQGVQLLGPTWDLSPGEFAVLLGTDGKRKFCRIDSIKTPAAGDGLSEAMLEGGRLLDVDIKAEVGRKEGTQVLRVQGNRLAKVLPLQLSDLQSLSAIKREGAAGAGGDADRESGSDGPPAGILDSLRRLMDVDKKTKVDDLPFQPLLSRSQQPQLPKVAKGQGERWGELNGWWMDKKTNKELFEIELLHPFGVALVAVEGEGLLVSNVEEGGNAARAGMRVGDMVSAWSTGLLELQNCDVRSILKAIVSDGNDVMRLRFERYAFAAASYPAQASGNRGTAKQGGERGKTATEDLEFEVNKPVGIMLIELPGYGVYVQEVTKGSNADLSGVRVGDRVLSTSSPLSYDAGTSFDRGTTYTQARKPGSDSLRTVLSAVEGGGDRIVIGVARDASGKALVELANASPGLRNAKAVRVKVDLSLTAKVRGALLDEEERVVEAKGRPLKVNLDLLNYHARRAKERKQPEKALSLLAKCIRLDPYDGRAWLATAKLFEMQGSYNSARDWLNQGIMYSPSNPYLLQSLGVMEERTGDLIVARALYVKATKIDPNHAPSWVSLGKLEERMRRQERARECYRAATKADVNSYYAWQAWAVLESRLGNTNEARRLFEVCSEVNPNNAAVWQAWGVLESRLRNYDVAVSYFERGLSVSPRNSFVLQAWAVLEWKRDDLVTANELFERAITYKPTDGGVYQAYAMLLKDRKLYTAARSMLQRGTEACSRHLALWQAWGLMEADLGNVQRAREIFQQGIWETGGSEKVHMIWQAWGLLEAKMGDVELARKYLSRAVEGASRPSACYIAWSRLEENLGEIKMARKLFEDAVASEPFNSKLWQAFEAFEKRVSGETSSEVTQIYERRVVSEMRSRGGVGQIGGKETPPYGVPAPVTPDNGGRRKRFGAEKEVDDDVYRAKWTTPKRRSTSE